VVELMLSARQGRDCTVVQVRGVLDYATAPQLRQMLQQLLDDRAGRVVVDFAEVSLMDSSGLGTLVVMFKAFREHDAQLCVAAVQPLVRSVLTLTSVDQVIDVYATVQAAEQDLPASKT
jgi:anti-sigma B factor antagonist